MFSFLFSLAVLFFVAGVFFLYMTPKYFLLWRERLYGFPYALISTLGGFLFLPLSGFLLALAYEASVEDRFLFTIAFFALAFLFFAFFFIPQEYRARKEYERAQRKDVVRRHLADSS